MNTPHVNLRSNEQGSVIIEIVDWELFDYIDNYLTEQCGFDSFTVQFPEVGMCEVYTIQFPNSVKQELIEENLSKLDPSEIDRIYKINN